MAGFRDRTGDVVAPQHVAKEDAKMKTPQIVSPEEWRAAREQLLVREKEVTRARDALAAERRRMPWMVVDTEYWFEGPAGRLSLADLFEGRCVIPPVFAAQNGSPPTFGRRLYLHFRVRAGDEDRTRIASLEGYVSHRYDLGKRSILDASGRG
jgi:hypothetical protein